MRPISTKTHGYLDYIIGVLLIAAPWLFNFDRDGAETWVPVILGIAIILYSLLTDYELGVSHMISMRTHLMLDIVGSAFLAVSPWLFNFDEFIWEPHVIFGIIGIGAALLTQREPGVRRTPAERNVTRSTPGVR